MPTLIDSYSETNQTDDQSTGAIGHKYNGQSFTSANNIILDSCKFYLKKNNLPTGNCYAVLYACTGAYGTNSKPTGSALAISDAVDVSTLGAAYALKTFTFSGINRVTLNAATHYCIQFNYSGGDASNYAYIGDDMVTLSAPGNMCYLGVDGVTWLGISNADVCFYVYGVSSSSGASKNKSSVPFLII